MNAIIILHAENDAALLCIIDRCVSECFPQYEDKKSFRKLIRAHLTYLPAVLFTCTHVTRAFWYSDADWSILYVSFKHIHGNWCKVSAELKVILILALFITQNTVRCSCAAFTIQINTFYLQLDN